LVLTADKLDGRSRFTKRAKKQGYLVDASPLRPNELRGFVREEAKRRGLTLRADAGAALVDALGSDLPAIDDALERLSLYMGDARTVELDAVERCVTRVATESIWALVDGMGARDRVKTLSAARSLLSAGEPPLRLLAMVTRQLRMLTHAHDALKAGAPPEQAARQAGAPPFKARELANAARRLDAHRIKRAFGLLADADIALKSSRQPPDTILESALLALTR
jgi:DNA polymerase-3 subunit delta